ncbi:uncharacterized protein EV154DRAFT_488312 [Mucor mucedo]|uniref:uncharacterized protein n=1 Tax=Mucor mucedo TaxID=29922 RepID=UPI002220235E|nr:uncharacterized protein EV154DRAFT_488312 [Mucor mucedo]KAI7867472.1 hypothetical protein EV154DRAFT_488312 [Mucor mucedo]
MNITFNKEYDNLFTALAGESCPKHNITATDGSILQYGASCLETIFPTPDTMDYAYHCPPLSDIPSSIDNCDKLQGIMETQTLTFKVPEKTRCNIQCDKLDLSKDLPSLSNPPSYSGAHFDTQPGVALIMASLLLMIIMGFKH